MADRQELHAAVSAPPRGFAELQRVLADQAALPTSLAEVERLADDCGICWMLRVPFAHPALAGMDALPVSMASVLVSPRFRHLRLEHLLTGDLSAQARAAFQTLQVDQPERRVLEIAREIFCGQAKAALLRRRDDVVPDTSAIADHLLRDLANVVVDRYRVVAKTIAPIAPTWLGRTRTKELTPDAAMLWEAYPPALERGQPLRVRIELDRWREGARLLSTSLGPEQDCAWFMLTLLGDLVTHLITLDRDGGARLNGIKRALGVAPWERFVAALDSVFDPRDFSEAGTAVEKDERVVWIIHDRGGDLDLSAKVQKRKAATDPLAPALFTKGKRASLRTISDGGGGAEKIDSDIASTLIEGRERTYLPADVRLDALEQLVGHAHVVDDDDRTVEVAKATIELAVVPKASPIASTVDDLSKTPADLELEVRLAGRREDPKELYIEAMEAGGIVRFWPRVDDATSETATGSARPNSETANSRVVIARPSARATALLHALSHLSASFPAAQAEALLTRLPRLANDFSLSLPNPLRGRLVDADASIVARLHPLRPEGLAVTFGVRPIAQSGLLEPGGGAEEVLANANGERVRAERNLEAERDRYAHLLKVLPLDPFTQRTQHAYACQERDAALDLLSALKDAAGVRIEWPDGVALDVTRAALSQDLRVQVVRQRDWFGVDGALELDDHQVGLALLFDALRDRRRYIELEGGKFLALSDALRAKATPLAALAFDNKGQLEVGAGAAAAMVDLEDDGAQLDADHHWTDLLTRLRSVESLDAKIPPTLDATLRPYQEDGVKWLLQLAHVQVGGILADDMGLGKTVQALAVLLARAARGPALVVAPTSVGFNWEREAETFAPSLRVILYRGKERERKLGQLGANDVVITSYGLLQRDAEALAATRFASVVFDEAQALKNASTKVARAARELDREWAFALSGTPVENHLGELWSIFRVVSPGLLGSWARFRERYARPIEVDKSRGRQRTLARALSPFLLRRTKAEVAPELPERTEVLLPITLDEAHRSLYEQARLSAIRELETKDRDRTDGDGSHRLRLLAAITRLRLCACHPQLLDPSSPLSSSKLDTLVDLLTRAKENGQRALVFSQFVRLLEFAQSALTAAGLSTLKLQGSTPASARGTLVDRFQAGEADAFLISLKAGGTGLNLTKADIVIHLDPWWNPAAEAQATDRAHRIGRKRPLTIYRLVATRTIEDEILALHEDKRALAEGVWNDADELGEGHSGDGTLSVADLAALLRDPKVPRVDPVVDDDSD